MNGDVYEDKDVVKAFRIEDGAEVEVPRRWLESGSPYRSSFTTTSPSEAAEGSGDSGPRKASESWSRDELEAAAVASGMSPEDAKAADNKGVLVEYVNSKA